MYIYVYVGFAFNVPLQEVSLSNYICRNCSYIFVFLSKLVYGVLFRWSFLENAKLWRINLTLISLRLVVAISSENFSVLICNV